jgi:hypothetical protein
MVEEAEVLVHGCTHDSKLLSSLPHISFPSPKSGMGAASIASMSLCIDFSSEWISLSRSEEWRLSLRFPSSVRHSCKVRRGGALGNAACGNVVDRWCTWRVMVRSRSNSCFSSTAMGCGLSRWATLGRLGACTFLTPGVDFLVTSLSLF